MLKEKLRSHAKQLGWDLIAVSPPTPRTASAFQDWLHKGYHGEMAYLQRRCEERIQPSKILPQLRSIVMVAKNYFTGTPTPETTNQPHGIISRYAWGDDYHDCLKKNLHSLRDWIEHETQQKAKSYIDTGPVLEKDFAAQSGIGWVGKHSNILNKELGNWFFLGTILCAYPFQYDETQPEHCGTCQRCIDICPTRAIVQPYVVDARLCISYLTIELKGWIPRELRPLIGNRIFGCDDCLEVCPWNRFAHQSHQASFQPRLGFAFPDLIDWMRMDEKRFRELFRKSPIKRTKRKGLLRNIAVALGNSKNPLAIPVLCDALYDHEPLIRGHAAWAIGQIGGEQASHALQEILRSEEHDIVRDEIQTAIQVSSIS